MNMATHQIGVTETSNAYNQTRHCDCEKNILCTNVSHITFVQLHLNLMPAEHSVWYSVCRNTIHLLHKVNYMDHGKYIEAQDSSKF